MNKNTRLRPLALLTLLVQVKTAATVQNQIDLLLKEGEFKTFSIRPLSEVERVKICRLCGSATTPLGPYGDGLELEFCVHGFRLVFNSCEIWAGGKTILRRILEEPSYFSPGLNKAVGRLRYHRLLIRPFLKNVGGAVALMSAGLNSFPSLPVSAKEPSSSKAVILQKEQYRR